jgi:hypothetical protein
MGQGIPTDEPIIDSVGDDGIILSNGTELSYLDLHRILTELGNANLLRSTILRDRFSADHAAQTFKEAGRVLGVVNQIQQAKADFPG